MSLQLRQIAGVAGFGAALTLAGASLAQSAPVDAYIPKSGVMNTRLMVVAGSPEDEQIGQKMQIALAKDRDWFMAYVKQHAKDDALPYDPRFGISKDEYAHIVHPKFNLKEIGQARIAVKADTKGAKVLDAPADHKALSGFIIAADGKSVTTPAGLLPAAEDIHNSDPDAPTGAWNGVSFATAGDPQHGKPAVQVAFGKREKEGDGIMYYKLSASSKGPAREIILLYPLN